MPRLAEVDSVAARTGFAGVVRVDRGGETIFAQAYGLACRAHEIENRIDTRFAIASGAKGLTALAVVSLIEDGALRLDTTARSVLGGDLPLIGGDVTVEHLLAHRSGIGDYLDEEAGDEITEYVLAVPAQELAATGQYLAVLDGYPAKFAPGERFSYCNGGYVVLALIAERVSGVPFHELVRQRVVRARGHAGHRIPAFRRAAQPHRDRLPADRGRLPDERVPSAGARQRGRRALLHRRGLQRLLAVPVRGPDRVRRMGRRDGPGRAATYPRSQCATGSASGCTRRPAR